MTAQDGDQKADALRTHRALNPHPDEVTDEHFVTDDFFDPRDLVQVKYEMLRRVREEGRTVSAAASDFGLSRQTFYETREALQREGLPGLLPKRPGPKSAHKLRPEVMAFARQVLAENPRLTSSDVAGRIEDRFGISVHPRSVERALAREGK